MKDAFDVGWLGMGAGTREFEERIHDFLSAGERHVVATNTGTSAIHIALLAAGIGPGDEVITPSFNYVADHQAIRMCGADVVMCDVRERDLGIDVDAAAKLVTKKTKAIIPLHFAGIPCDREARPLLDEVLALRADRMATVRQVLADLTDDRLAGHTVPVTEPGYPEPVSFPVRRCLQAILNEEWEHRLYAERDFDLLQARPDGRS